MNRLAPTGETCGRRSLRPGVDARNRATGEKPAKVELLYFEGCPNWKQAAEAVRQALALTLHHDVRVDLVRVETQEQAEARGFIGSPTLLLDGRDPFAIGAEQFGLACRVFRTADGLAGFPSVGRLTEALDQ